MTDDSIPQLAPDVAAARIAALAAHPLAVALLEAGACEQPALVGGALRDAALGRPVADLDAVVARDGEHVATALARRLDGRAIRLAPGRFEAWRVVSRAGDLDLWDLAGGPLAADLRRRDLTVNAIALDLAGAHIVDPHQGLLDLCGRRLRAVEMSTFEDDPLRVLRLARFRVDLAGFVLDPETAVAAHRAAPGLDRVAGERVREELSRLCAFDRPAAAQEAIVELGIFPGLWGGFRPAAGCPTGVAELTRFEQSLRVVGPSGPPPAARVAAEHALRLRIAVAADPAERAGQLATRAILSRLELRAVRLLLDRIGAAPVGETALALHLWSCGELWPEALCVSSALAPSAERSRWQETLEHAKALVDRRGSLLLAPRPLLDGDDVAALLGLGPGPEVGAALRALTEAQVTARVEDETAARAFLLAGNWRR